MKPPVNKLDQAFSSKAEPGAPRQQTRLKASTLSEWSHPNAFFEEEETERINPARSPLPPLRKSAPEAAPAPQSLRAAPAPLEGVAIAHTQSLDWASQLAITEKQMERQGTVDLHPSLNKQEQLKQKTREFLQNLQNSFREKVELFNESRQSPAYHIHIYKVSNTPDDFMLYRNGVKLVVSGQRAGRIVFAFNQFLGHLLSTQHQPVLELQATWGALDQLSWTYRGERVTEADLLRYLLSEFIYQSFK
jgi:hypothetical protein